MKNDGEYPLPSKVGGEGGLASANTEGSVVGRNGQGDSGLGEVKQPIHPGGTSGSGKEHAPIPVNEAGRK